MEELPPPPPPPTHTHTHTHTHTNTHTHTRTSFVGLYSLSGTRSRDISKSREIECSNYRILLTFDKRLYNIAAVRHAKVYDDQTTLSRYLKVFQISQNLWEILHAKMLIALNCAMFWWKKRVSVTSCDKASYGLLNGGYGNQCLLWRRLTEPIIRRYHIHPHVNRTNNSGFTYTK